MSGLTFVTDNIAELLKSATYFAYNELPEGLSAPEGEKTT